MQAALNFFGPMKHTVEQCLVFAVLVGVVLDCNGLRLGEKPPRKTDRHLRTFAHRAWQDFSLLKANASDLPYVHDRCVHIDHVEGAHDYDGVALMTLDVCHDFCKQHNSFYFGVRGGSSCWCADSYYEYWGAGPARCDVPCNGNSLQICGGADNFTDVYIMGGKPCNFSISTPTSPPLGEAMPGFGQCTLEQTAATDDLEGNLLALDKHDIHCDPGKVLTSWDLYRPNFFTMQFHYKCCLFASNPLGTCENKETSADVDGGGNLVVLDRHDVNCDGDQQLMTEWHLHPPSDGTIKIQYQCCNTQDTLGECTTRNTADDDVVDEVNNSLALHYHQPSCKVKEAMKQWKLVRSGHSAINIE